MMTVEEIGKAVTRLPAGEVDRQTAGTINALFNSDGPTFILSPDARNSDAFRFLDSESLKIGINVTDSAKCVIHLFGEGDSRQTTLYLALCKYLAKRDGAPFIDCGAILFELEGEVPFQEDMIRLWEQHGNVLSNPENWSV